MNTPTPRTDAATALTSQHRHDDSFGDPEFGWVTAGFARTLERELAFQVARNSRLFAQRDEAVEAQEKAEAELAAEREKSERYRLVTLRQDADLAAERAIVSRIWTQLGSPTYAQLKGRSIYDLIEELKEGAK